MNGVCWWDGDDYRFAGYDQVKLNDLPVWLNSLDPTPDIIVYENFKLWKHRALQQSGSDLPAAQAIGMIKSYAMIHDITLVDQSPQILGSAAKMSGMKMPTDHSLSHWISAYNHSFWWLVKHGHKKVQMEAADK